MNIRNPPPPSTGEETVASLRRTLRQTEQLLEVAGVMLLVLDPGGRVTRINPFGCTLLGRTELEILGRDWFESFVPPPLRENLRAQFKRMVDKDPASLAYHDNPVLTAAGGERLISWHNAPLHDEQGGVTGVLSSGRDITDLKLAEDRLNAREEQLRIILETAADSILALDAQGQVVFANTAAGQLLDREILELVGQPITDLMPERYRAAHLAGFNAYQRSGKSTMPWQHIPLTVLRRDGQEIPVEVSFGEQRLRDGHLFIGVIRDVSERRRAEEALRASEHKYRTLVEHLPLRVFQKDRDSVYVSCNEAFARFLGMPAEDIAGHTDQDFFPPELASKYRLDDQRVMASGQREEFEEDYLEQGETHTARTIKTPVRDADGRVSGVLGIFSDITEHKRAGARLRQAAKVFESTAEGVTITDAQGNIVAVNRAFCEITGYSEAEVLGQNPRLLKSGRHDKDFYRTMWAGLTGTGNWRGEIWNRRKNGEVYPEWLTISAIRDDQQRLVNYVGVFSDISHIKRSEAQLEHLTLYDPLTELPNRLLFNSRLEHALERARHQHSRIAVLCLDLDRFKTVNDSLGHPVGDELLIALARRLAGTLDEDDTLGRLGGDEFVILLEDLKHGEDAAAATQKMLHALERPFRIGGRHEVYIAASVGVSLFPDDASNATQLLRNADAAMYQAKEQGRNTYRFYTEALTRAAGERLTLEAKLRRALERGEFVLHYQPQVSVRDGVIVGLEALVRWQCPEEGLIPPGRFIPLAEETGLIVPLGEWVLFTACAQMKEWLDRGMFPVTLAVNLSPRQFHQADLVQHVHAVLDATELPPHLLELEITESAIMEQGSQAVAVLDALKAVGVQLAIDDFGTGYSSLAYLKRFAVDKLKIDQNFIRDIPQDRDDMEIAATIISMARNLRLEVLAEGVETEAQLDFLREHGCESYQGYLYSRPLPAAEIEPLLAQGRPHSAS